MSRAKLLGVTLSVAALGLAAACSLNPQPLPPESSADAPTAADGGAKEDGATYNGADSGAPGPSDGGGGDTDAASGDAAPDAAPDAPDDAPADAPDDAARDASDDGG